MTDRSCHHIRRRSSSDRRRSPAIPHSILPPVSVPPNGGPGRDRCTGQRSTVRQRASSDDAAVALAGRFASQRLPQHQALHDLLTAISGGIVAAIVHPSRVCRSAWRRAFEVGRLNTRDPDLDAVRTPQRTVSVMDARHRAGERRCWWEDDHRASRRISASSGWHPPRRSDSRPGPPTVGTAPAAPAASSACRTRRSDTRPSARGPP